MRWLKLEEIEYFVEKITMPTSRNSFVVSTMQQFMAVNGLSSKKDTFKRLMKAYYEPDEFPESEEEGPADQAEVAQDPMLEPMQLEPNTEVKLEHNMRSKLRRELSFIPQSEQCHQKEKYSKEFHDNKNEYLRKRRSESEAALS